MWTGPPKTEAGRPENVYSLDTTGLTQVKDAQGSLRILLKPGTSFALPDGKRRIEMTGVTPLGEVAARWHLGFVVLEIICNSGRLRNLPDLRFGVGDACLEPGSLRCAFGLHQAAR
ncbi:hypothetical protein GCM10022204_22850 [Microlunatus aurantiacus]|uniref:Uncharacterized protein n=1 Tax=Microlunatus aurantiacus TaxID=446786 RepID=A0ABP7DL69_9ACTN